MLANKGQTWRARHFYFTTSEAKYSHLFRDHPQQMIPFFNLVFFFFISISCQHNLTEQSEMHVFGSSLPGLLGANVIFCKTQMIWYFDFYSRCLVSSLFFFKQIKDLKEDSAGDTFSLQRLATSVHPHSPHCSLRNISWFSVFTFLFSSPRFSSDFVFFLIIFEMLSDVVMLRFFVAHFRPL